jgi:hypothetical protein
MSSTTHAIAIQAVIQITSGRCYQASRNRLIALAKLQDIQVSGVRVLCA